MIPTKKPIPQKPREPKQIESQVPEADKVDATARRGKVWIWAFCIVGAVAVGVGAYFLLKNDDRQYYYDSVEDDYRYYEDVDTIICEVEPYSDCLIDYDVIADSIAAAEEDMYGPVDEVVTVRCDDDFAVVEDVAPSGIAEVAEVEEVVPVEENTVYTTVEQMPQFPGGDGELLKYISNHMRYPIIAMENNIQGRVVVNFVVKKDGTIGDVTIARGKDPDLDKEAVRIVKNLPRFTPGRLNGQAVNVWYTLPVTFKLQQ